MAAEYGRREYGRRDDGRRDDGGRGAGGAAGRGGRPGRTGGPSRDRTAGSGRAGGRPAGSGRRDDDRGYGRRDDDRGYGRRDDDRGYRGGRDERRPSAQRDAGRAGGSRGANGFRGREDERNRGRDERGYGRRDDRDRGYGRRDDDRGYGRRVDRGYGRQDDRGYGGRDERGYGRQDDRERGYGRQDDRDRGYGRRDDRPRRDDGRRPERPRREDQDHRTPDGRPSRVWHNGRRYVGGTTSVRNSDRGTTPRSEGERDAQGVPLEGTPERPIIPDWDGTPEQPVREPEGERLQKVIAAAGVASRRVAENLIVEGRVTVNGEVVEALGRRVDPESDAIEVDGVPVQVDTSRRYVVLNKPTGVVSSMLDERGRPDLSQFVDRYEERLFNVGRLDAETSGLLVLTNDGALAHVLAHPSFGVTKTYIAKVDGSVTPATVQRLLDGVDLEDGPIAADKVRLLESSRGASLVEITLHSGRNRIVRRMLDAVGHPVQELVRRSFGPLHLGTLPPGRTRELSTVELGKLLAISRSGSAPAGGQHDVLHSADDGTEEPAD